LELFYIVGFSNVRDRRGVNGEEEWPQYRALGYTNGTRYGAISQLQTQQVMTSQIRSHIEYLIQT